MFFLSDPPQKTDSCYPADLQTRFRWENTNQIVRQQEQEGREQRSCFHNGSFIRLLWVKWSGCAGCADGFRTIVVLMLWAPIKASTGELTDWIIGPSPFWELGLENHVPVVVCCFWAASLTVSLRNKNVKELQTVCYRLLFFLIYTFQIINQMSIIDKDNLD